MTTTYYLDEYADGTWAVRRECEKDPLTGYKSTAWAMVGPDRTYWVALDTADRFDSREKAEAVVGASLRRNAVKASYPYVPEVAK